MTTEPSKGAFTIIACVGRGPNADFIVPHALAVGKALNAPVTLLQVLEAQGARDPRPDPIEWDMRRHDARKMLGGLATVAGNPSARADIALAEGRTVDEICRYANGKAECVIILGRGAGEDIDPRRVGSTVHNVAGRAPGSILLVPNDSNTDPAPCYRRILVPVDGSAWAESVLPLAVRMAKANNAELILVHVVPTPELTEIGPLEPDDIQLSARVVERNERTAKAYLARVKAYLAENGVHVRTLSRRSDDVRASLVDLIGSEAADLVILSARGHGGRHHADLRYGSVSAYLMAQSPVPLLIVRPRESEPGGCREESAHLRRPSGGLG
jgi:nucleotide-binding universal stress UspA family protein